MRGFATGSDGLAEVVNNDLIDIVLPRLLDKEIHSQIAERIKRLMDGEDRLAKAVVGAIGQIEDYPMLRPRKSHCVLV